jgi:phage host-nuclease inhibitor protein Gam
MSKNRIKLKTASLQSRAEAEALVNEITGAKNNERRITAKMDAEILAVREKYGASLDSITQFVDEKTPILQSWAAANPDEFGKRKSIEFATGTIGFRTGTPKLKTLRGWTWETILGALILLKRPGTIRTKVEVDKDGILALREKIGDNGLAVIGMKVVQDETFYVEPNLTETETRSATEAKAA